jgi:hypothetical protein
MSDKTRLTQEMLATAEALRRLRAELCRRLFELAPGDMPLVRVVLVEGAEVVLALQSLATQLT